MGVCPGLMTFALAGVFGSRRLVFGPVGEIFRGSFAGWQV